ncbi:sigma factor [Cupriavidus alkaliphilus]|uniref:sigma factor n=1 Tax=Cupriavidus alkaliphilus TaxID=942866 RepID=UPI0017CE0736|nr:sigma factor [Cupriavidus alkaliphilus]MBB2919347.1 RNA polymerase sigma factor (sigma-70 family) [Cupriavidus alkaliphilus]
MMARAQAGDRAAYRRLLEGITPFIRALAARQVRNPGDIEDIVQDVLRTIHTVRRTYDPARPFGPWLVAIARRRIIDCVRWLARTSARETPFDTESETIAAPRCEPQGNGTGRAGSA